MPVDDTRNNANDASDENARTTYELHVAGLLGPVLLAGLPHASARHLRGGTVLVVRTDETDLVDVLERIVRSGVEVESVRELTT